MALLLRKLAKSNNSGKPQSYLRNINSKYVYSTLFGNDKHGAVGGAGTSLWEAYKNTKELCLSKKLPSDVNPRGVFVANELDLQTIEVYGFDYDYTLASYKTTINKLIYDLGKQKLVHDLKYPKAILGLEYIPQWAIRGLHYDFNRGLLLKVDSFLQIQLGTVYRGLRQLSDEEVLDAYKSVHLPIGYVEGEAVSAGKSTFISQSGFMKQLLDIFSLPEMCLLSTITQYFEENRLHYHPAILFDDVNNAVKVAHSLMHKIVEEHIPDYLDPHPELRQFLERLHRTGKKTFLITNSPFRFVERGMMYLCGADWMDLFDIVICQARKPKFFTDVNRPFRKYHRLQEYHMWDTVTSFQKGEVYLEGTVSRMQAMTGWEGRSVLYFGDHLYTDLADATLHYGWRTGAIIPELSTEIETLNNNELKENVNWLQMLSQLVEDNQDREDADSLEVIDRWIHERDQLRIKTKSMFNPQFGSMFRTHHNPTYFSRRLNAFADIYMNNVTNLNQMSLKHTFFPRRGALPHEYRYLFI